MAEVSKRVIDIHSHILPGLDDGAQSLEESLAMLEMAAADGTTDIVATPHANHTYPYDPESVDSKIQEVSVAAGGRIRIHRGCDLHLSFDNIESALADPYRYTINRHRYLLVEFSDLLIPKTTDDVFGRMLSAGVVPIITHPERNGLLQSRPERLDGWVRAGCLIQVTAASLLGRFGRQAKAASDDLMRRGLVHFIASDAHDTRHRPPTLSEAFTYVSKGWGPRTAEHLFSLNPMSALVGDPIVSIPGVPLSAPRKPWYRFW